MTQSDGEIRIVSLSPDDVGVLERVHEDVFDESVRPERAAAYLADPTNLMMVALTDGLVIAQVAAVVHRHPDKPTELYVDEVGVAEPWRRRGLAREMLMRMFAHGKALGCEEVWVGTESDNHAARRLYESLEGKPAETFVMYVYEL